MMPEFADNSTVQQAALAVAIFFLVLTPVLLLFRRGILMQLTLLASLIAAGYLCVDIHLPGVIFLLLFFYIPFWFYTLRRFNVLTVKDQLDREWAMLESDFEADSTDLYDFPDFDLEFFDAQTKCLKEQGFKKLDDVVFTHIARAFPMVRHMVRVFLSYDGDIALAVAQQKAEIRIIPLLWTLRENECYVEMTTEFTDGTIHNTNNAPSLEGVEMDGMSIDNHPHYTTTELLLEAHRESVERIIEERGVEVRRILTRTDWLAAAQREQVLMREDRLGKGGAAIEQNRREAMKTSNIENGKSQYHAEYVRQAEQRARRRRG